jgi:hypothetical protein
MCIERGRNALASAFRIVIDKSMKFAALAILFVLPAACATSRPHRTATRTAATEAPPAVADGPVHATAKPAREAPRGPTLDRQGCDPKGKATLAVQEGKDGAPTIWRYYVNVKHGGATTKVLKCEASDNNGDGFVDARFFYDDNGQLVLEQRDLDFDGHAEVIADYSHFSFGHLVQANDSETAE